MMLRTVKNYRLYFVLTLFFIACRQEIKQPDQETIGLATEIKHAQGFTIRKWHDGITIITVNAPWPNASKPFTYALVPKITSYKPGGETTIYDAVVRVPVERVVVTSTTHIPALEALGVLDKLIGFPGAEYISSEAARTRIANGHIQELGKNEAINTEIAIGLQPDLIIGFGLNGDNPIYETLQRSNIPVAYNGDWTEQTPLGKAEWIKFFAPFFGMEEEAETHFETIEKEYLRVKNLAKTAQKRPTVFSGALYKDVWYLPGGKSWAAQFLADANAAYLWADTPDTGSLALSWESVLEKAHLAEFWIGPAQFTSYHDLQNASAHYTKFNAFTSKNTYTYANTKGSTGGLLYYELAPHRPDLVLKDLINILHPGLLPEHNNFFFKPLD